LTRVNGVDRPWPRRFHLRLVQQPRHIYASSADRRTGRRWSRRRRPAWVPWMLACGIAAALLAGELIRSA
jgi:hypothetical protein